MAGVATAVVVERATGLAAQIKWPNDVMLDRRKVAGGLAELKDAAVVLGIGLNVMQAPDELPADTKVPAGSLRSITGRMLERGPILADLLLELEQRYEAWRDGGLDAIYDDIGARDFLRGRRVTVDGVSGTAQMINREGLLEIETPSGRRSSRAARSCSSADSSAGVFAFASTPGSASTRRGLTPRNE